MALDLRKTVAQIEGMAQGLDDAWIERGQRLDLALRTLVNPVANGVSGMTEALLRKRVEAAGPPRPRVTFLVAGLPEGDHLATALARATDPPAPPAAYLALATDGSQIALDRHAPVQCFLINTGGAAIRYGAQPGADLFSQPRLFSRPEELVIADAEGAVREQPIDNVLLGIKRTVMEMEALAERIEAAPADLPALALLDGSLVRWELSGNRYPDHVRKTLLQDGFLAALDRVHALRRMRRLAFASYISRPRSTEVTNILRVARCPHRDLESRGCDAICGPGGEGHRECDEVAAGLMDRDLFARTLQPGQRSALFASQSPIVREYGPHEVSFCYLNLGAEVARLEMPEWVAQDAEAVGLLHALVLDQCRKGNGYPVVLQEAHEAAVVTEADRRTFWSLVESTLVRNGLSLSSSQKARSKRVKAV